MKSTTSKTSKFSSLSVIHYSLSFILAFAMIYGLSNFLERAKPPVPEEYIDANLSLQGAKIKGYALGMEGLIAD